VKIKIVLLVLGLVLLIAVTLSAQNINVRIQPVTQETEAGQVITVNVLVENVTDFGAFQFDLLFNSDILQANAASIGAFPGSTGRSVIPVGPQFGNTTHPGKVTFGCATLGINTGPAGNGILAMIEFTAQTNGFSTIELQNMQVSNVNGQMLTLAGVFNGEVLVGSTPASTEVTNTNDSGPGSLRWAIEQANSTPVSDDIRFAIPTDDPGCEAVNGVWRIKPLSELPALTDAGLNLDGWSQQDAAGDVNPDGPEIVLDGSSIQGTASGLLVAADDIAIYGINIQNFTNAGIWVSGARGTSITECLIGTDHRGLNAAGNNDGIVLINDTRGTLVGSSNDDPGNVISGNKRFGVFLSGAAHNLIRNNRIGVNQPESDTLGNRGHGISIQSFSHRNHVAFNFIGGNGDGVAIFNSDSTEILGNWIGTDSTFTRQFGQANDGIYLWGTTRHTEIIENVIGYNGEFGISVGSETALYNRISRNAISRNRGPGIMNWSGGNNELAPPTNLVLTGTQVQGQAQPEQIIEIFADEVDEGRIYLGSGETDEAGSFSIELRETVRLANLTATATDANGNTSDLSAPFHITAIAGNSPAEKPTEFALCQNYPNPFNPKTTIRYSIPAENWVELKIYNVRGAEVQTLVSGKQSAGQHSLEWSPADLPSGIYTCQLKAGDFTESRKLIFLK